MSTYLTNKHYRILGNSVVRNLKYTFKCHMQDVNIFPNYILTNKKQPISLELFGKLINCKWDSLQIQIGIKQFMNDM